MTCGEHVEWVHRSTPGCQPLKTQRRSGYPKCHRSYFSYFRYSCIVQRKYKCGRSFRQLNQSAADWFSWRKTMPPTFLQMRASQCPSQPDLQYGPDIKNKPFCLPYESDPRPQHFWQDFSPTDRYKMSRSWIRFP